MKASHSLEVQVSTDAVLRGFVPTGAFEAVCGLERDRFLADGLASSQDDADKLARVALSDRGSRAEALERLRQQRPGDFLAIDPNESTLIAMKRIAKERDKRKATARVTTRITSRLQGK
jgi:hypothetical protein